MRRLLLLLTGGTLMMTSRQRAELANGHRGAAVSFDEERASRDLVAEVPSLARMAEIEPRLLFHMDSANMQPSDWVTLAREVHDALPKYDGVVMVHGTDTMAYTASALALMLGPLPKPVVLTGSQKPLDEPRTDARQNLIDATLVATLGVPEVVVAGGSRALRGARSTKRDAWGFAAFDSPNCAPLVELGMGVEIASHVRTPEPLAPLDDRLEPRVLAVRVFPGLDPELVRGALRVGVQGLVLEAYGTGNLPLLGGSLIPVLEEARERNVPVVIVSQCHKGFVELGQYEGSAMAEATGVISAGDMTVEAALAKLMVGIPRTRETGLEGLRAYFAEDVVGERDV